MANVDPSASQNAALSYTAANQPNGMVNSGIPLVSSTGVTSPTWYSDLTKQFGDILGGMANSNANLGQNWYSGPLSAGLTSPQVAGMQNTAGALSALQGYQTSYDPNQTMRFMDPYTQSAIQSVYNLGNQNLMENILPQVNSTFTGAGQFGGSRNADFTNRAIRDTQQAESNTAGNLLNTQYNNAMNQQYQWNQNPIQLATTQGNLANQQFGQGTQAQTTAQGALTNAYNNWLQQQTLPQTLMGGLATTLGSATTHLPQATTTTTTSQPAPVTGLGALGYGLQAVGGMGNTSSPIINGGPQGNPVPTNAPQPTAAKRGGLIALH